MEHTLICFIFLDYRVHHLLGVITWLFGLLEKGTGDNNAVLVFVTEILVTLIEVVGITVRAVKSVVADVSFVKQQWQW